MPDRCPFCDFREYVSLLTVRLTKGQKVAREVRICKACTAYHPQDRLDLLKAICEAGRE